MSTYEPGTVAMVTALNRSTPWRAYFDGNTWRECGANAFCVDTPTSIRPLVVLDLTLGDVEPRHFVTILREREHPYSDYIANQIEAQTKPPRIPEPGLWGIVKDRDGTHYVREDVEPRWRWHPIGRQRNDAWEDIVDPVLVRDGIEDGAR